PKMALQEGRLGLNTEPSIQEFRDQQAIINRLLEQVSSLSECLEIQGAAQRESLGAINDILARLTQSVANLSVANSERMEQDPISIPVPIQDPISRIPSPKPANLNASLIKEASKRVYNFPESYKLLGPSNYNQWEQSLTIMLQAMDYKGFILNPSIADNL